MKYKQMTVVSTELFTNFKKKNMSRENVEHVNKQYVCKNKIIQKTNFTFQNLISKDRTNILQ